jgi:GR25 family glycosyltransferase involved in LPS biosynthesis
MKAYLLAIYGFVGAMLVYFFYTLWSPYGVAQVDDVWVINLDRSPARWAHMVQSTQQFGEKVHRFPAMDGKTIRDPRPVHTEGVGYYFMRVTGGKEGELVNKGVVGCWLSHKRLLTHLAGLSGVGAGVGHLILEDDVQLPDNFLSGSDRWSEVARRVPYDWDIVYLGMSDGAKGTPVADGVVKLAPGPQQWGTYAYLVKHGSIRTKLLPALRFMTDAIDEQYNSLFNDINAYCIRPAIIVPHAEVGAVSSILHS